MADSRKIKLAFYIDIKLPKPDFEARSITIRKMSLSKPI